MSFFRIISEFCRANNLKTPLNHEEVELVSLKGGRSQADLVSFSIEKLQYVLRLFPLSTTLEAKTHQIHLALSTGKLGVGPKVLYVDPKLDGIVMEFISGRTVNINDFENPNRLIQFANLLKRLHGSKEPFLKALSPFQRFRTFLNRDDQGLDEIRELMEKLEALLERHFVPLAPTHLDLNPLNIMLAEDRFVLVDWVNGGLSDPYYDLGTFAVFQNLKEIQAKVFLEAYFGHVPTQFEWNRFQLVKPIRLFVIGAAFSPRAEDSGYTFEAFLKENSMGKCNKTHAQISSIMFKKGLEITLSKDFLIAFNAF